MLLHTFSEVKCWAENNSWPKCKVSGWLAEMEKKVWFHSCQTTETSYLVRQSPGGCAFCSSWVRVIHQTTEPQVWTTKHARWHSHLKSAQGFQVLLNCSSTLLHTTTTNILNLLNTITSYFYVLTLNCVKMLTRKTSKLRTRKKKKSKPSIFRLG